MNEQTYSAIRFSGGDAEEFLQGQMTQDIGRLATAASLPTAWCNPKGRVITTGRLLRGRENIDLVLPAGNIESVLKRLTMYRLRSNVEMQAAGPEWLCGAIADEQIPHETGLRPERQLNACCSIDGVITVSIGTQGVVEVFGQRDRLEAAGLDMAASLDEAEWRRARVLAGLADIVTQNSEKYTPHMLNLDAIGAISFEKGCYTGQEVVARTQNLGKSKRRLMLYRTSGSSLAIGDPVSDAGRDVGSVVNVSGEVVLAVTPVALHERSLEAGDAAVEPLGLPYSYLR